MTPVLFTILKSIRTRLAADAITVEAHPLNPRFHMVSFFVNAKIAA
jgi:hypothetical protein